MRKDQMAILSDLVLEAVMADCLHRMETASNPFYIEKQIMLFRKAENELHRRRSYNDVFSKGREIFGQ